MDLAILEVPAALEPHLPFFVISLQHQEVLEELAHLDLVLVQVAAQLVHSMELAAPGEAIQVVVLTAAAARVLQEMAGLMLPHLAAAEVVALALLVVMVLFMLVAAAAALWGRE
jgi:hypothetical protein